MTRPPGGIPARFGFRFSDLVLIGRALQSLLANRKARIEGVPEPVPVLYLVESPAVAGGEPLWDIVEATGDGGVVVEEVKSAPLDANDRITLWQRIRRTAVTTNAARVSSRLTTNESNPTPRPEWWLELPSRAALVLAANEDPSRVTSASALAREALFHLTTPGGPDEKALSLAEARDVLSRFSFETVGEEEVLADVERNVSALSNGLAVRDLCNALSGEIDRRASSSDQGLHKFSAEDLYRSSEVLAKLADVPGPAAHEWQRLRAIGRIPARDRAGGALAYQPWNEVQPEVAEALALRPARLALVGRGGLGKSVLLQRIFAETDSNVEALWLTGHDLRGVPVDELASCLELGSFVCTREGRSLLVLIDALESAGDTSEALRSLLSSLGRISAGTRVVISIRDTQWRACQGATDSVPRWVAAPLMDWGLERVRSLVKASRRPSIGPELLQLLSTPLLLDLFLRTFGTEGDVPTGLESRHAVLEAYWRHRVLPDGPPASADRRTRLMQAASEEANGNRLHDLTGPHAAELASEGIFSSERGRYSFRHPLLRDFALGEWAIATAGRRLSQPVEHHARACEMGGAQGSR